MLKRPMGMSLPSMGEGKVPLNRVHKVVEMVVGVVKVQVQKKNVFQKSNKGRVNEVKIYNALNILNPLRK